MSAQQATLEDGKFIGFGQYYYCPYWTDYFFEKLEIPLRKEQQHKSAYHLVEYQITSLNPFASKVVVKNNDPEMSYEALIAEHRQGKFCPLRRRYP